MLQVSCSTPLPKPVKLTTQEQLLVDQELTRDWAARIETKIPIVRDVEVEVMLRKMAESAISRREALALSPIGVLLYQKGERALPASFAVPGNRIYLSIPLVKALEFENELVAAIAMECASLLGRYAVSHAQHAQSSVMGDASQAEGGRTEFFGPAGVFAFTYQERAAAVREAVHIIYEAGYDPRGLVSYLRKIQTGKGGVMDAATLGQLEESARSELNRLPPLRNPVVRSEAFQQLKRRVNKL